MVNVAPMFYCVHCGAGLRPGARSCNRCGSIPALADRARSHPSCRVCNSPQASSWRHCGTCGTATARVGRSAITRTTLEAEAGSFSLRHAAQPNPGAADYEVGDNRWPAELHPQPRPGP